MRSVCAAGSSGQVAAWPLISHGYEIEARVEWVLPGVDAVLHVRRVRADEPRAEREDQQSADREPQPVRRDVEHRQEAAEEHQRRTEVADDQ
jgi:hypothetical protein